MSGWPFVRFAVVFAARDLFGGPARGSTLMVLACVAGAFAAVVALFGWVRGNDHGRRQRELDNPLALCLIADADRLAGSRVTPQQVAAVELRAAARPAAGVRVTPFDDLRFDCQRAPATRTTGEPGTIELRGRAVSTDDPLGRSVRLRPTAGRLPDRWFMDDSEPGVVVTAKLLRSLGYFQKDEPVRTDQVPQHLVLRSPVAGTLLTVPVLGLSDLPLPLDHLFVLSAGYVRHLRTTDPDDRAVQVKTGPLKHRRWTDEPPPPAVVQFCRDRKWNVRANGEPVLGWNKAGDEVWEFSTTNTDGQPVSYWRAQFDQLRGLLAAEGPDPGDGFTAPQVIVDGPRQERKEDSGAGHLAVYVSSPDALEPVANDLEECGLRVDREVIEKLKALDEQTRFARGTLRLAVGVLVGVAGVAVFCLLKVRLATRTGELGLLKAMGLSECGLLAVYAVEGAMLGLLGVAAGAGVGGAVGWLLPGSWAVGAVVDGFRPDVGESSVWAGLVVLFSTTSVLLSVARPVASPPLLTLSREG